MFTLAISSCQWTQCSLLDHIQFTLINGPNFQVPMQYCSLQHQTLLSPLSQVSFLCWPIHFILSGAIHNCPLLFPSSILDTFQPRGLIFWLYLFAFSYCSWSSCGKTPDWFGIFCSTGPHFVRTLHYNFLGWPCRAWLIASLSYASLFAMTRLWSMKIII